MQQHLLDLERESCNANQSIHGVGVWFTLKEQVWVCLLGLPHSLFYEEVNCPSVLGGPGTYLVL